MKLKLNSEMNQLQSTAIDYRIRIRSYVRG